MPESHLRLQNANGDLPLPVAAPADDVTVIDLDGDYDLTRATALGDAAERALAQGSHLILDLSRTTFVDSTVLHRLSLIQARAQQRGKVAVLQLGDDRHVRRVLAMTRIDVIIPCCETREAALETIRRG